MNDDPRMDRGRMFGRGRHRHMWNQRQMDEPDEPYVPLPEKPLPDVNGHFPNDQGEYPDEEGIYPEQRRQLNL